MSEKLPSKYQVGDVVWHAMCDWLPVERPCPVCFGNKEVMLTLGNGDEMMLPCQMCAPGYEKPSGVVTEYEHVIDPKPVTITGIEIECNGGAVKVTYQGGSGSYCYQEEMLFDNPDEAAAKGAELKAELDEAQRTKSEYLKKDKAKSFSWNAGYHMREARRGRESAEYHERMAVLCKERVRGALCRNQPTKS